MDRQKVDDIVVRLRKQGFAVIEPLTPEQIAETNHYLLARTVYRDAHVPQTARSQLAYSIMRDEARDSECICVPSDHAILAPHIFERALDLTDVAAAYLERDPPVCYSANVFWTRPGTADIREDIQAFHKDYDDVRFLVMFVYLTDVMTDADGPQDLYGPDEEARAIFGPAGTVFLADTSRSHRGRKPTTGERGLAWFRWGVSDRPPANEWDKTEPISRDRMRGRYPEDTRLQESIKLLVQ